MVVSLSIPSFSLPCFPLSLPSSFRYFSWTRFQKRFHRPGRDRRDELLQPLHFWRWGNGGPDKGRALYQVTPPVCGRAVMRTHFLFLLIHQSFHWLRFVGLIKSVLSNICPWAVLPWVLRNRVIPHRELREQSCEHKPANISRILAVSTATEQCCDKTTQTAAPPSPHPPHHAALRPLRARGPLLSIYDTMHGIFWLLTSPRRL